MELVSTSSFSSQAWNFVRHGFFFGNSAHSSPAYEAVSEARILIPSDEANEAEEEGHVKLRVKNLWRTTEAGSVLLKAVTIGVPSGSIVVVIGPSGSGKSTFLRAFNRLWEPPLGSVFLDGDDITKLNVLSLRRRIGMLFQTPALFEGTVADNLRYGPALHGKKLTDNEVRGLLASADLEESMASRSVDGLSVGQAQRVALARTLANDPEVLLLDEPTSALDPVSTQNIEETILKLKRSRGMTIIMVSHSLQQVQRLADFVCVLVDGEIVEVLPIADIGKAQHAVARKFLELSA